MTCKLQEEKGFRTIENVYPCPTLE
jgi:hypothetical protein